MIFSESRLILSCKIKTGKANQKLVLHSTSMSISFVKMLIFISETDIITKKKHENTFLLLEV